MLTAAHHVRRKGGIQNASSRTTSCCARSQPTSREHVPSFHQHLRSATLNHAQKRQFFWNLLFGKKASTVDSQAANSPSQDDANNHTDTKPKVHYLDGQWVSEDNLRLSMDDLALEGVAVKEVIR
jgi:hypothetical protein